MLGQAPKFNRELFYGSGVKILGVMEGEVAPEYPHDRGLDSRHPQTSVHAIGKKVFIGLRLNLKHAFRVSVGVFEKVTTLGDLLKPLLKHPFAKLARVVSHGNITKRLPDVGQQAKSGISKSVDAREVTISEPKLDGGVDLTAGSVKLGNGGAHCGSSISSPNRLFSGNRVDTFWLELNLNFEWLWSSASLEGHSKAIRALGESEFSDTF
jgi:hypothetical protein